MRSVVHEVGRGSAPGLLCSWSTGAGLLPYFAGRQVRFGRVGVEDDDRRTPSAGTPSAGTSSAEDGTGSRDDRNSLWRIEEHLCHPFVSG